MVKDNKIQFEKDLESIRMRFIVKIESWLPIFTKFYDDISNSALPIAEDIEIKMHQLSGSAKTFGFENLNKLSIQTEYYLKELQERNSDKARQDLQNILRELLKEIHSSIASKVTSESGTYFALQQETLGFAYHILIADDDELVLDLLSKALEHLKCKVSTATNGKQVLDIVKKASPDLIILDINMPEKPDGSV